MKTERRHELEHNVLADWLGETIVKARDYSRAIGATIVALLVVGCLVLYMSHRSAARKEAVWQQYIDASTGLGMDVNTQTTSELERVLETAPDSPASHWARLTMADIQLAQGSERLFGERATAATLLVDAEKNYAQLAKSAPENVIRERAAFGVAKALESQGRLDDAQKAYEDFLKAWPSSVFAASAQARLNDLKKSSIKDFYAWFESQGQKSPLENDPGVPGHKFNFDSSSLPSTPRTNDPFIKLDKDSLTPIVPKTDAETKSEGEAKPATTGEKSEAKPDGAKPAEPKSTDAKPTDDKPAQPKP